MPYKNKEDKEIYNKQYYRDNKEKLKEQKRQNYKKNREKENERSRQYRIKNREKLNEYSRLWKNKNYKIDLKFNLNYKMGRAIRKSLKGNKQGRHWEELVGYTLKDLIKRLKKTIPKDYNWQGYLNGDLHIDHIIPIDVFNYTKPEHPDFKRCWTLNNLRLLPAKENLIKGKKLTRSFQPALKI